MKKGILILTMLFAAGRALAQGQWIDSILPADHLLEVLPWMGEDGKVEGKGLFDFEDLRGAPQKDLLLIYRPSVPVSELDKPHNQTLVVCFFDTDKKDYVKRFQDDGGEVQWVRLAKGPSDKAQVLVFLRNGLKGNKVLKGYTFLQGAAKQVLDVSGDKLFVRFTSDAILCSTQDEPRSDAEAPMVYAWNDAKGGFVDKKSSDKGEKLAAAPTAKPASNEVELSSPGNPAPAATGPQAEFAAFKAEIPGLIAKGQIAVVGQKAKGFFEKAQKDGLKGKDYTDMRSAYYTAVASAVLDKGDAKGAAYYLRTALQLQPDNPEALALKAKLK